MYLNVCLMPYVSYLLPCAYTIAHVPQQWMNDINYVAAQSLAQRKFFAA